MILEFFVNVQDQLRRGVHLWSPRPGKPPVYNRLYSDQSISGLGHGAVRSCLKLFQSGVCMARDPDTLK